MKQVGNLLLFLLFIIKINFAEHSSWNEIKMNKRLFYTDSSAEKVGRDTLEKHLRIISEILDSVETLNLNLAKKVTSYPKDSIRIIKGDYGRIEFINKMGNGNFNCVIMDRDGALRTIYFSPIARNLSKEEMENSLRTNQIPDSYKNISEKEAIAIAKKIHRTVYGKEDDSRFDSISCYVTNTSYAVHFYVKIKNDICDLRTTTVMVNANTGEIEKFYREGPEKIDFNYVPKIKKSQVLQMYNAVIDSLHATIKIRKMYLSKFQDENDNYRWAWHIYGQREDKYLGTSAMIYIDSETGEVLFNKMDY